MCTVYGNATINIAASSAIDGTGGCFNARSSQWRHRLIHESAKGTICYEMLSKDYNPVRRSHLTTRGWAFQERLLAPRTLHFTEKEVVWECRRGTTFERLPSNVPNTVRYGRHMRTNKGPTWKWLVENYSSTSLTYATDRLVALSGVARDFQMRTGYHYIAGMWRESLGMELCWAQTCGTKNYEDDVYVAPTWSWASMKGTVELYVREQALVGRLDYWISIVDVDIKLKGSDPFGQLVSATLRLECSSLLHATACLPERIHSVGLLTVAQHQLKCKTYMSEERCLVQKTEFQDKGSKGKIWKAIYDVHAMIVRSSDNGNTAGILLSVVPGRKGTYTRVGCFYSWGISSGHSPPEVLKKISKEDHGTLGSEEYVSKRLDESGHTHYTIDII